MSKRSSVREAPPCFARVIPGLEPIATEEITRAIGGEIKRTSHGLMVFRVPEISAELLRLRTTEDVFLYGWGTDRLTYRAEDLDRIRRWTSRDADWAELLRYHHAVRPKPKGKPTYRIVTQMTGKHGYRRMDARQAFAEGLAGAFPPSWRHVEENAAVEFWLTIEGQTAVSGVRLSDRTMRHRTYKIAHLAASLRPTLAAAMVQLAGPKARQVVLDPMCGAGTILAELFETVKGMPVQAWGGDIDQEAMRAAGPNLRSLGRALLARWDARRLPLASESVDRIISNPPFGKQLGDPETIIPLYRGMVAEYDRVLRPGGQAVLLVADAALLGESAGKFRWKHLRHVRVRILGQRADLTVWRKPGE